MNIHFIAIGGSVMHNLAICIRNKGYKVSGSDDEIFEPARSKLKKHGLLPPETGWHPEKINEGLDAIILGMHAQRDNPELLKAQELGIKIYSFPAFVFQEIKDKKRVVIAGSHGKTSITSMILHVLKHYNQDFDYLVGSKIEGFDLMVKLTEEAPVAILEGDEYLSSALEKQPKFLFYHPHITLISGIAWDHMNVFPTEDIYKDQFRKFIETIEPNGTLIYNKEDEELRSIVNASTASITKTGYQTPEYRISGGRTILVAGMKEYPLAIFGRHNLQNLEGAKLVCGSLGIKEDEFYRAIQTFSGAAKRLELIAKNKNSALFKDFAHSPSKLKATIQAVKEQFPERKLIACMELHTYSSLNKDFLKEYEGTMDHADLPIIYYNHHTLELKRLPDISPQEVHKAFGNENIKIFTESDQLKGFLQVQQYDNTNLLMMSSGNFDGLDWNMLKEKFV